MKKNILVLFAFVLNIVGSQAQVWEKFYPGDQGYFISETTANQLLVSTCVSGDRTFLSIDENGELIGSEEAGLCANNSTFDGGMISFLTTSTPDSLKNIGVIKFDSLGQVAWQNVFGSLYDDFSMGLLQTRDSGIVVSWRYQHNFDPFSNYFVLTKFDKDGLLLWNSTATSYYGTNGSLKAITESGHDGSILYTYSFRYNSNYSSAGFKAISEDGTDKFGKVYIGTTYSSYSPDAVYGTTWGGAMFKYYLTSYSMQTAPSYYYLNEIYNASGNMTTHPKYAPIGIALDDGSTVTCANQFGDILIKHIDGAGGVLRENSFQGDARDIIKSSDGNYFVTGKKHDQTWLMKLDSLLRRPTVAVRVFWDDNGNCQYDPGEVGLGNRNVSAKNTLSDYAAKTGKDGIYYFKASRDTGTTAHLYLEQANWSACWDSLVFDVKDITDTIWADFPVNIMDTCSLIKATIGAKLLYYSSSNGANIYEIKVSNAGLLPIKNAVLKLSLDSHVQPGPNWPFISIGPHEYELNLGTLPPLHIEVINVNVLPQSMPPNYFYCSQINLETDVHGCNNSLLSDEDCQPKVDWPSDPYSNQLIAYPVGETDEHFINGSTEIQYKINFFKNDIGANSGAEIYDTLSPHLDVQTLISGASNYVYTTEILNDSVLHFSFPHVSYHYKDIHNVLHFYADGYVKYRISPKKNTSDGSIIKNKASTYFSNGTETTNMVFHTISTSVFLHEFHEICRGEYFGQNQILNDTTVIDTFLLAGYDSIVFHHFQVLPDYFPIVQQSICEGDSIFFGNGYLFNPGEYIDLLNTHSGCDSIITLKLSVRPIDTSIMDFSICQDGESPLTGMVYDDPGEFTEQAIFLNQYGCDSTVTATITVHPEEFLVVDNGPVPYGTVHHGIVLTQDTQFVFFDTTEFGCLLTISENVFVSPNAVSDFEKTLNLTVFPNPTSGEFFVEMDLPQRGGPEAMEMSVEVLDMLGRQVAVVSENAFFQKGKNTIQISTHDWPAGTLFLQIKSEGQTAFRRIIKIN